MTMSLLDLQVHRPSVVNRDLSGGVGGWGGELKSQGRSWGKKTAARQGVWPLLCNHFPPGSPGFCGQGAWCQGFAFRPKQKRNSPSRCHHNK